MPPDFTPLGQDTERAQKKFGIVHTGHYFWNLMEKEALKKTVSRGVRLEEDVWGSLDKLAKDLKRTTGNYLTIILGDHVKEKSKIKGKGK